MVTSIDFTGGTECKDDRVLFSVHCLTGVAIRDYSAVPDETEVLLPTGTMLKVRGLFCVA